MTLRKAAVRLAEALTVVAVAVVVGIGAQALYDPSTGAHGASVSFEDGTWFAGDNIPAGTYHAPGGPSCIVNVYRASTGTITPHVQPAGQLVFTLAAGDALDATDCGLWVRS